MKTFIHFSWMVLYLVCSCHCMKGYSGKHFIITVSSQPNIIHKQLEVVSNNEKTVIQLTATTRKKTITMDGLMKQIPIKTRVWGPSKAIAVHASDEVQINTIIVQKRETTKYNILPVQRLSTEYTIVNYLSAINCMGVLQVVATEKNTLVNIKFRIEKKGHCSAIRNGYIANMTLTRLGVYTLRCGYDLTDTVVSSNKPVAVIVGSECPRRHGVDITEMMMVPNNVLGFSYVLPSRHDMASLYRVVCPMHHTRIESSDGKNWICRPKKYVDIKLTPGKPICLLAHKPVRVLGGFQPQLHGNRRRPGRPKRIGTNIILQELPSTGQFLQKYHMYDHRMTGPIQDHKGRKVYAASLVVQRDMVDVLINALSRYVDRRGEIEKRNIESCEFVTLSFYLSMTHQVLESPVPFWMSLFKLGPVIDYGIFPGALLDITNCPSEKGYLYFPADDWCLKHYHTQLTRRFSKRQCRKDEGHLVDIPNGNKQRLIATVFGKGKDSSMYIGARRYRRFGSKVWLWSNCSLVSNYHKNRHGARCMTLHGKKLKWKQTKCKTNTSSLCEVDVIHGQFRHGQVKQRHYSCKGNRKTIHLHRTPKTVDSFSFQTRSSFPGTETSYGEETKLKEPSSTTNIYSYSTKHQHSHIESDTYTLNKTDPVPRKSKAPTTAHPATSTELEDEYDDYNYDDSDDNTEITETRSSPNITNQTPKIHNFSTKENTKSSTSETHKSKPSRTTESTTPGTLKTPREPAPRTLNMTLLMELYKQQNPDWKNRFAARRRVLSRALKVKHRCHCFCKGNQLQNTSQEAIEQDKRKVQKQLGVKKSSLKKALSMKISAADKRPSAAIVGCIGFLFLLLPFALIVLSDVSALMAHHRGAGKRDEKPDIYLNSSLNSLPTSP